MSGSEVVVKSERISAVAVVTVDSPPVNALSHAVRSALKTALDAAIADPAVEAIVLACAGRTFIAGADIGELGKPRPEPLTPTLIATLEASPKPVVAALHGTALGGGFELAMGCHYRVAVPQARMGLPEVKIGILPGAGGTQRLPRLVGVPLALDMIATGEPINAARAHEKGVVDEIVTGDLRTAAIAFAERAVRERLPLKRVRDRSVALSPKDDGIFARYRADYAKRRRGLLAPQRCIAAVEAAATQPFDEGLATEARFFAELVVGDLEHIGRVHATGKGNDHRPHFPQHRSQSFFPVVRHGLGVLSRRRIASGSHGGILPPWCSGIACDRRSRYHRPCALARDNGPDVPVRYLHCPLEPVSALGGACDPAPYA